MSLFVIVGVLKSLWPTDLLPPYTEAPKNLITLKTLVPPLCESLAPPLARSIKGFIVTQPLNTNLTPHLSVLKSYSGLRCLLEGQTSSFEAKKAIYLFNISNNVGVKAFILSFCQLLQRTKNFLVKILKVYFRTLVAQISYF